MCVWAAEGTDKDSCSQEISPERERQRERERERERESEREREREREMDRHGPTPPRTSQVNK